MRISDWSSDVCSSDLMPEAGLSETGMSTTSPHGWVHGVSRLGHGLSAAPLTQAKDRSIARKARSCGGLFRFGDFDAVEARGQGLGIAALGELDPQPDLVGRVGVAQRVLVADLAGLEPFEQGLVEGQIGRAHV